jgi:hypothetical protein
LERLFEFHVENTKEMIFHYKFSRHDKFCSKLLEIACDLSEKRKMPEWAKIYKNFLLLNKRFANEDLQNQNPSQVFQKLAKEIFKN